MKYKYSYTDVGKINKFGIDLTLYDTSVPGCNLVLVDVSTGHLEEFYHEKSTFMYLILEGNGTFVLNDEHVEAEPKDLIVIPPKTRIHYFGKMKMVLCTTPAWEEKTEHHVRMVDPSESPYARK